MRTYLSVTWLYAFLKVVVALALLIPGVALYFAGQGLMSLGALVGSSIIDKIHSATFSGEGEVKAG